MDKTIENAENKVSEIKGFELNGKKYSFVNPGARWYLQALDKNKNSAGVLMQEKYMDSLFSFCVAPKVSIEDFNDDLNKIFEVSKQIESFLGA